MWKTLLAGTAAAAIAGSTIVYAQQRSDAPAQDTHSQDTHSQDTTAQAQPDRGDQSGARADRERPGGRMNRGMSREDRAAFMEARMAGRLAALKAGLQLSPDQDKLWPAYESAVRDMIKLHRDRMAAARPQGNVSQANGSQANGAGDNGANANRTSDEATARMRRRAEVLTENGAALKHLADAQGPLFSSFDEGQKRRFSMLSRMGRQMGRNGGEGGVRQERRAERDGDRWQQRSGPRGEERGWRGRERDANRDDGRAEERNGRRGDRVFRGRDEDGRAARGEFGRGERGGRDQYRQDREDQYRNDDGANGRRGGDRDFRRGDRSNSGAGQRPEEDADHSSPRTGESNDEHL